MPRWNNPNCGFQKGHPSYWNEKMKEKIKERWKGIEYRRIHTEAIKKANPSRIEKLKGRKLSEETKKKISLHNYGRLMIGEKSHFWRGGISFYRGTDWNFIRVKVWQRDNFTCQICGTNNCKPDAHHIVPYRISKNNSLDNLITLCRSCHMRVEKNLSIAKERL